MRGVDITGVRAGHDDHRDMLSGDVSPEFIEHFAPVEARQRQVQDDSARLASFNHPQRIQAIFNTNDRISRRSQARSVQFSQGGVVFNNEDVAFPWWLRHTGLYGNKPQTYLNTASVRF